MAPVEFLVLLSYALTLIIFTTYNNHRIHDWLTGVKVADTAEAEEMLKPAKDRDQSLDDLTEADRIRLIHDLIIAQPSEGGAGIYPTDNEYVESILPLHDKEFNKVRLLRRMVQERRDISAGKCYSFAGCICFMIRCTSSSPFNDLNTETWEHCFCAHQERKKKSRQLKFDFRSLVLHGQGWVTLDITTLTNTHSLSYN